MSQTIPRHPLRGKELVSTTLTARQPANSFTEDESKEPSDSPKKRRRKEYEGGDDDDDDSKQAKPSLSPRISAKLQRLAESSYLRRSHILEKLASNCKLSCATVPFPENSLSTLADQLSNPAIQTELPFPFAWDILPERFECTGEDQNWVFMGREKFPTLLDAVKTLQGPTKHWHGYHLYGTIGYGKSHLLAALVCYLIAADKRVVYIPDCRAYIRSPVDYIQAAILFTWGAREDSDIQNRIMSMESLEDVKKIFNDQPDIFFVVDQLNAFDSDSSQTYDNAELKKLFSWIEIWTADRRYIYSASANNKTQSWMQGKQTGAKLIFVYGGFNAVSPYFTMR